MTKIEWTRSDDGTEGKSWNPVVGCTPVSPGCLNCYAATMARRLEAMGRPEYVGLTITKGGTLDPKHLDRPARGGRAVFKGKVRTVPDRLTDPLHWRKPRRVFVNSMSDLFHEAVPFEFIDRVFAVMALCPQHTFQVLTKRPERMAEYLNRREIGGAWTPCVRGGGGGDDSAKWKTPCDRVYTIARQMKGREAAPELIWPLPNVWLGTSVEDQPRADERIPHLRRCPAAVRFLSCEPLLGPVDLSAFFGGKYVGLPGDVVHPNYNFGIHWCIIGGESGPNARPCDVAWIRSIVGQCRDAGVPVFVKQLGAWPRELSAGNPPAPMPWVWDDGGEQIERWYKPRDRKGGEPSEWPEDLRVRQWPGAAQKGEVR